MNILIIQQPLGNRGDESAHRAFIGALINKYPYSQITVLFFNKKWSDIKEFIVDSPLVSYKNIRLLIPAKTFRWIISPYAHGTRSLDYLRLFPSINRLINYYKQTDLLLCAPGGINLGGFKDWLHLSLLRIAMDLKIKIGYFGRSIGPFSERTEEERIFKQESIKLLHYFSAISLRDNKSLNTAKDLCINTISTIDSAFLRPLAPLESHTSLQTTDSPLLSFFKDRISDDKYFAFIPNSLVWHYKYSHLDLNIVTEFWAKLLDGIMFEHPELKVVMLPQTTGYSKKVPDGYIFFEKIKALTSKPENIIIVEEKYGSDFQQAIISKAEFLIGARYHSIVFAINQSTPFISLTYEHKMKGLLEILKLEDREINIENLASDIDSRIESILKEISVKSQSFEITNEPQLKAYELAKTAFDSFLDKAINQ